LSIVQRNMLLKNMDFKSIFIVDTSAIVLSGITAISLALFGFGVWCLVLQSVMINLLSTLFLWLFSPWRPSFVFDKKALGDLFHFSANMLGFNISNFFINNTDKILIGRLTGSSQLGVYTRAYQLMLLPINQISGVMTRVMFPALSLIQNDKKKVKEIYLRSTRVIALVTFPLMMGLMVVAKPFTLTLFGEKWLGIVPLLQIFCLAGIGQSIGTTTGWLYTSQGRTDVMFKWSLFAGSIRIISMVIGLHWGITGVAAAYVIGGYTFLTYPGWTIAGRLINLRFSEMVLNLAQPFLCATLMGTIVFLSGIILPCTLPQWALLTTQIVLGILAYLVLIHFLKIKGYAELRLFIAQNWTTAIGKDK
jgi:O-antigen/teichoic acid export membrane protein